MYVLEAAFLLITVAWLIVTNRRGAHRRAGLTLFLAGIGVGAAAFALDQARIHMVPAALAFAVLSLLLFRRGYSHIAIRALAVVFGSVFIAASVLLAFALPVVTLAAPTGPHTVGAASFTLVDASRDESAFGAPGRARELYVQAWYPAATPDGAALPRPRSLWAELSRPPFFNVLFGYLRGIATHSYDGLALATAEDSYPAIVFSPSLGGIAEQNTLLMEHLASHGYIVFGVTHPYFGLITTYADGTGVSTSEKVMQAMTQQGSVARHELAAREALAASASERASIRLEYFEQGIMLNDFMAIWSADLRLLLDAITGAAPSMPAELVGHVDANRIGLLGMSYGGGAVTQVCRTDTRCRAAVNLDGGLWGERMRQPLTVPYLVLASSGNASFFEHDLLTSEAPYYELTVQGATHPNFTDVSAFVPLFAWLGATGPIDGERVIEIMNVYTQRFFDAHVRGITTPALDAEGFPELTIETNLPQLRTAAFPSAGSIR
jgi:hypothetical protein